VGGGTEPQNSAKEGNWRGGRAMSTLTNSVTEQLKQEHAVILAVLRQLKALVRHSGDAREDRLGWQERVAGSLSSLCSHLKAHFAFEESGGFMTDVIKALPNLASNVTHLKEDHKVILDESEELCKIAKEESLTSETLPTFALRIFILIRRLERHEQKETALVQSAFVDDLGMTD
jgi:hypothetical protein